MLTSLVVEKLISAAMQVLHHDADFENDREAIWEVNRLRQKFAEILDGTTNKETDA